VIKFATSSITVLQASVLESLVQIYIRKSY